MSEAGELFPQQTFNGVPNDAIEEVFEYWKLIMKKRSTVVLDDPRKKKITAAIKRSGVASVKLSIDGCLLSSWHQGQNPRNKKYDDIELILRNAQKQEDFEDLALTSKVGQEELDEWLSS